jgi:acetyl-CoA carboxylase carboxyl transferase subunit alpha
MLPTYLDFEKPIAELEQKIDDLRRLDPSKGIAVDVEAETATLSAKSQTLLAQIYAKLTPWQKTQVARHPQRPHFRDYLDRLIEEFVPLSGDRVFGEDKAIIGGLGRFRSRVVMVIGQEKGFDTATRLEHNFGMARPEGYRKAVRLMRLADRFGIPVITLIDTAGAFPGLESEARGIAEAIARSTDCCLSLTVPLVSVIIGEGGSGGAIALATANRVMMLEHAVYSVISPEACSSILWRAADKAQDAAAVLKLTAQDLLELKVIDQIIPEPMGGAHRDPAKAMLSVGDAIEQALSQLERLDGERLKRLRREKFLAIGRSET